MKELRETVLLTQEQALMQREDYDGWLMREKEQLAEERDLVHQLRSDTLRQKQAWADSVTRKESQLRVLVEEKKEELSVMEIAIRQQIADAKKKEQQLYEKEDGLRRTQLEQLTEFEEQKKALVEERRWLESVRDEVDSRMNNSRATVQVSGKAPGSRVATAG